MYQLRSDYVKPHPIKTRRIDRRPETQPGVDAALRQACADNGIDRRSADLIIDLDDDDYTPLPDLTTPGWYW